MSIINTGAQILGQRQITLAYVLNLMNKANKENLKNARKA